LTRRLSRGTVIASGTEETIMGRGVLLIVVAISAAVATGGSVTSTRAANWFEKNFWLSGPRYDSNVPSCDEHGPLDMIVARFRTKEGRFWNSTLTIVGFEKIREVAWEPWNSGTMPRRYCVASVLVSDGTSHQINYSIIEDSGMIGASYGVEWCVAGLDRDWAYNPGCRAARP
jgi:hypothetical protein